MLNWTEFNNYDTSLYHVLEEISSQQKKIKKKSRAHPSKLTIQKWQRICFLPKQEEKG
jgi:hypothetical protein